MKKVIIGLFILLVITGCGMNMGGASKAVKKYLNNYQDFSDMVEKDLDKAIIELGFNKDEEEKYKKILKKQYQDLTYEIIDEKYDGDTAKVDVRIKVYDFYDVEKRANEDLIKKPDNFVTDGINDVVKFIDYKLDMMLDQDEKIEYEVTFDVKKEDNKWVVVQPDSDTLKKISGTYEY